ncbi:MAG: ABC transporter permease [Deltaproteobacteria bacterium]|nr:MAG: ABC transporter permease [Deltaproteobacteria bacterium]
MTEEFDLIIEPSKGFKGYWRELWRYRELFFFLAWRDVLVRYKQTILGLAWAIIRPFLILIVLTVVFGKLAKFPTEGRAPYPVLVLTALLPWQLFANALSGSSSSLINNASMISKIYFPRIIIPMSSTIVSFIDFLIAFALLVVMMFWYGYSPDWKIILLPCFVLIALLAALGGGLWMSALNVKYRDFRYIVPFIVQFGLYISPVGFSSRVIPEKWRLLYALNPMVAAIDGFRWSLLGGDVAFSFSTFLISSAVSTALFWSGLNYFRKTERSFADMI